MPFPPPNLQRPAHYMPHDHEELDTPTYLLDDFSKTDPLSFENPPASLSLFWKQTTACSALSESRAPLLVAHGDLSLEAFFWVHHDAKHHAGCKYDILEYLSLKNKRKSIFVPKISITQVHRCELGILSQELYWKGVFLETSSALSDLYWARNDSLPLSNDACS